MTTTEKRLTQAERIIAKFGNARRLSQAMDRVAKIGGNPNRYRSPAVVYRWTYPKERGGTGGKIPSSAMDDVMAAARLEGIILTAEDWFGEGR